MFQTTNQGTWHAFTIKNGDLTWSFTIKTLTTNMLSYSEFQTQTLPTTRNVVACSRMFRWCGMWNVEYHEWHRVQNPTNKKKIKTTPMNMLKQTIKTSMASSWISGVFLPKSSDRIRETKGPRWHPKVPAKRRSQAAFSMTQGSAFGLRKFKRHWDPLGSKGYKAVDTKHGWNLLESSEPVHFLETCLWQPPDQYVP